MILLYPNSIAFGVHAGAQRNLGMSYWQDSLATTFALNESTSLVTWNETSLLYYYGYAFLGISLGNATATLTTTTDENYLNALGSGYGGLVGINFPFGKNSSMLIRIRYLAIGEVAETNQKDAAIGAKTDIEILGTFELARGWLDMYVGLMQRTYSLTVADTSGAEALSAPVLGLKLYSD